MAGSDWGHQSWFQFESWRCHWRCTGAADRPALVLLHGFGASSGHWRDNAEAIAAAGYRVYAMDLLGFGQSDQPGGRLDNRLWSRQLQCFLEQIVGKPAVVAGNSLGSLVGLTTAVFRPELVIAVAAAPLPDPTLLSPLPLRRSPWSRRWQRWLVLLVSRCLPLGLLIAVLRQNPLLRMGLASAYAGSERIDNELVQLIRWPASRSTAGRALGAMVRGMALRPARATAPQLLLRLNRPLLLLWGRRDRLVPPVIAERVVQQAPAGLAELHWLEGLGHCPHDEAPEAFNTALIGWLKQQSPTR
ncbi:MAG: alpha/beta fold hydrolase [Synechococcus sp.]